MVKIRPATVEDVPRITEIYNEAILNTTATFDTEPKPVEEMMRWLVAHNSMHPVLVVESGGIVIGYASLSRWSDRCAYDGTAEVSLYIDSAFRGQGIGKKLLEVLTLEGEKAGLHNLISRISEGNFSSIHIHEILGYEHIGIMKEAGKKFGKFMDVHLMQKLIGRKEFE
jgi:L-amino acid N-acyltransferase